MKFVIKITQIHMSGQDLADKAEIHAFHEVMVSTGWLDGQDRSDVSCPVSQVQQILSRPTFAQVCASNMVVCRVLQHSVLGLEITRESRKQERLYCVIALH